MDKDPYLSAYQIAKKFDISPQTEVKILFEDLEYLYRHFHWVRHLLTCEMKEKRVTQCKLILSASKSARQSHFCGIMTAPIKAGFYKVTSQYINGYYKVTS